MFKVPKIRGLLVYAALTLPIVVSGDWFMRSMALSISGHDALMSELVHQLKWCAGDNIFHWHIITMPQATDIYNSWLHDAVLFQPWEHVVSDNLTLTVYMAMAARLHGLPAFCLLASILGTFGVVTLLREHIPVPWKHKQPRQGDIMEDVLDAIEGNTEATASSPVRHGRTKKKSIGNTRY